MRLLALFFLLSPLVPLKGMEFPILLASYDLNDTQPFFDLPISSQERQKIYELIHKMGTQPWHKLLWNKKKMEKLGAEVDHVHPLRFLGVIIADGHLKGCLQEVSKSGLKMGRFMDGLKEKLEKNHGQNNLLKHVAGFAQETHKDAYRLEDLMIRKRWNELVDYLLE